MGNEQIQSEQDKVAEVAELTERSRKEDEANRISERQKLIKKVEEHLIEIGVPTDLVLKFLYPGNKSLEHTLETLRKMNLHLLTKDKWEEFAAMPRNLDTLKQIKLPILCGWTEDEIKQALTPYIIKISQKYATGRCDIGECIQNGSVGILKAIRTDAGIAPFSCHVYRWIQTRVRRPSAESGIVRTPEKRPSKDEVRILLTTWFSGKYKEFRRNKLIKSYLREKFAADHGFLRLKDHVGKKKGYSAAPRSIKIEINKKIDNLMAITAQLKAYEDQDQILHDKITELFSKRIKFKINNINYLDEKNLQKYMKTRFIHDISLVEDKEVQRTGKKHIRITMVKMSFNIEFLDDEQNKNLVDCLTDHYWTPYCGYPNIEDFKFRLSMCQTVNEIVSVIACPPDFHGNPNSLDAGHVDSDSDNYAVAHSSLILDPHLAGKDEDGKHPAVRERVEEDPAIIEAEADQFQYNRAIVNKVKNMIRSELTGNQRGVFDAIYGENPVTGTELSKNFSKYTGNPNGKEKVSRQRIAQYLNAIQKKFVNALFEEIINKGGYEKIINTARLGAKLTEEEDSVIVYLLGLDGNQIYEIEELTENYERLMRSYMPDECYIGDKKTQREKQEAHVREVYQNAKKELMRTIFMPN